jgi:hypothetical protein
MDLGFRINLKFLDEKEDNLSSFFSLQEQSWRIRDFICGGICGTTMKIIVGLLVSQKMSNGAPLMETTRKKYLGECKEGMMVGIQEKIQYNDCNNNKDFIQQN